MDMVSKNKINNVKKVLMALEKEVPNEDYEVADFCGIDVEPEDRSVGIFGNTFILGAGGWTEKWVKGKRIDGPMNLNIVFGDDEMQKLLVLLKPYYERADAELKWSKEEEKRWQEEQKENKKQQQKKKR